MMSNRVSQPQNAVEAVTLSLYLALTAPTDELAQECCAIAEKICIGAHLTDQEIDTAKAIASAQAELFPLGYEGGESDGADTSLSV